MSDHEEGGQSAPSVDAKSVFDAFYRHFVLRDLFGKIVPGLIVLAFISALLSDKHELKEAILNLPSAAWIAIVGAGWLAGFAIQSLGEQLGLVLYYPTNTCFYRWFKFRSAPYSTWP